MFIKTPKMSGTTKLKKAILVAGLIYFICYMLVREVPAMSTMYYGGPIITMEDEQQIVEAVLTRDGKIQSVGTKNDVAIGKDSDTRMVDLAGMTLMPGFIDPHSHFPNNGNNDLFYVDLNSPPIGEINTLEELLCELDKKGTSMQEDPWIKGFGYDNTLLKEKRHPNKSDLDSVA